MERTFPGRSLELTFAESIGGDSKGESSAPSHTRLQGQATAMLPALTPGTIQRV